MVLPLNEQAYYCKKQESQPPQAPVHNRSSASPTIRQFSPAANSNFSAAPTIPQALPVIQHRSNASHCSRQPWTQRQYGGVNLAERKATFAVAGRAGEFAPVLTRYDQ